MLIDSGVSLTLVNSRLFQQLPYRVRQSARYPSSNFKMHLADKSCVHVQKSLTLPITISGQTNEHVVHVVPKLWRTCIIGNDFIQKYNLQVDGGRQRVYFKDPGAEELKKQQYILLAAERVKIPPYHAIDIQVQSNKEIAYQGEKSAEYEITTIKHTPCVANGIIKPQTQMSIQVANLTRKTIMVHPGQELALMTQLNKAQLNMIHRTEVMHQESPVAERKTDSEPDLSETDLTQQQREPLKNLIQKFSDIFKKENGRTKTLRHHIKLTSDAKPYNSPPYRYAPAKRRIIEQNIKEMKEQGIIESSKSPWACPLVLAPKKDGLIRFSVDYHKLNSMTVRDAYPIPRIDDTLDALQGAKFISTLELRSGYWQVEMDKKSKEKTAFISNQGLYEFNVMPYGLTNAPATFQRLMDIVLAGLKWQCCLVYIDDVVIYSPTFEQHLVDLENVFQAIRQANLTLKATKCSFFRKEMKYLGHVITQDGVKPDPTLIQTVSDFPQPKTIKDVQSFLGLSGYYRRFIKNYAKIAEPLYKQLRQLKDRNYHLTWNHECTNAFETLKRKLTSAPIMSTPNFNEPFILELDACEYGLGAVLAQEYDKRKFVISYASRTLAAVERNYSATEREALAIVWATQHFRPYLEGYKVLVRSDCKALQWLENAKDVTGRLARWAMKLSAFQIENIQYRPGAANTNADSLSRNPINTTSTQADEHSSLKMEVNQQNLIYHTNTIDNSQNFSEVTALETINNLWQNINILDDIKTEQQADSKLNHIIQ